MESTRAMQLGLLTGMFASRLPINVAAKLAAAACENGSADDSECMDEFLTMATTMNVKQRSAFIGAYEMALLYLPEVECIHELPPTLAELTEPCMN